MIEVILNHDDVELICKHLVNSVKDCKACTKLKTALKEWENFKIILKKKKKRHWILQQNINC